MVTMSRRGVLASAAVAAAFGLNDKRLAFINSAQAQTPLEPANGVYKYKVGSIEVTAVYDGIWRKPHDPAFIKNASVEETREALAKAGMTTEFMPIPLTVIVLKIGDKYVMVDSGSGVGQWQAIGTHGARRPRRVAVRTAARQIGAAPHEHIVDAHRARDAVVRGTRVACRRRAVRRANHRPKRRCTRLARGAVLHQRIAAVHAQREHIEHVNALQVSRAQRVGFVALAERCAVAGVVLRIHVPAHLAQRTAVDAASA